MRHKELLTRADTAAVKDNLSSLGVNVDREVIQTVKQYNFDSQGIVFDPKNHDALGRDFSTMAESQQKQWKSSFDQSYDKAHQQGVKADRDFLSQNNMIEQGLSQTGSPKGAGFASTDGVRASGVSTNRIAPNNGINELVHGGILLNNVPRGRESTYLDLAEQTQALWNQYFPVKAYVKEILLRLA
ncbi:MAG: hypothetical protein P8179_21495 [Candidatus Thiodiazotropha sp.]